MSPVDTPSFQKPNVPKTGMGQIKEHFTNTLGAVLIATPMLAMSALDNSAYGAEKALKNPIVATKALKTEEKLPQIALENEQIYEFLNGNISQKDTLASLQKKLQKKLRVLSYTTIYDDFLFDVHCEVFYRQKTDKPESQALKEASEQMRNEQNAIKNLSAFFATLETEDINKMNRAIIDYYNAIGGSAWGEQRLETWKKELAMERTKLRYTYQDAMLWMIQYEKQISKGKQNIVHR